MKNEIKKPFASNGFLWNPAKQEVLLHLRDGNTKVAPHKWAFFGGAGEEGETPMQAFIREIAEELSIDIQEKDILFFYERPVTWPTPRKTKYLYSFYVLSDMPKSEMKLTEGADFDWVWIGKVFDINLTEDARKSLKVFIEIKTVGDHY